MMGNGQRIIDGLEEAIAHTKRDESHLPFEQQSLVFRLRKRAEIRRANAERKSVREGRPDRVADLLEEAADRIDELENASADAAKGREMAGALHAGADYLDGQLFRDSAERCRAGAAEINRLLDVIRTRDKHIADLQTQLMGPPGPFTIGECVLMGDRTPEFAEFINDGKAVLLVEMDRDDLRTCGAMLFKKVRVSIDWSPTPERAAPGSEDGGK
jgi:hypothetical protein